MSDSEISTLYLGVDAGGSSCRARLRDSSGRLLGEGLSGAANLRLGMAETKAQILRCCGDALRQAALPANELKNIRAGLGIAGAVLEEDKPVLDELRGLFKHCAIHQDAYIACLGAHGGEAGGIVVLGTGSCAQITSPSLTRSFGGWGSALSDQGSGAWLGKKAIRCALQSLEGIRPPSAFSEAINTHFKHRAAEALRWSDSAAPADYARFAPPVFEHAEGGDAVAIEIVESGCHEVSRLLQVLRQAGATKLCLVGGLAAHYVHWLSADTRALLRAPRYDAQDGALLMAGLSVTALSPAA